MDDISFGGQQLTPAFVLSTFDFESGHVYYPTRTVGPSAAAEPVDDQGDAVPRPSLREKILTEGFHVVLEQGYCGATVRDIVRAAGVPQGSFTNHFESKEAFCLELLIRYFAIVQENITKTLRNDSLKPLLRLRQWFDIQLDFLKRGDFRNGCLIGNFSAEVGAHSETIHAKLTEMYEEIHASVVYCLKAAVKSGDLPATTDCNELAHFLFASLQGAILQTKIERNALPMKRFMKIAFSTILR